MPTFRYVAVTHANEKTSGEVTAADIGAATRLAAEKGIVLKLEPARQRQALWAFLNRDIAFSAPINARTLAGLTLEWSNFLTAGLPLDETLKISAASRKGARSAKVIEELAAAVKSGSSLSEAMRQHGSCFPNDYVALIRAGETSGSLASQLSQLHQRLSFRLEFQARLRSALLYPAFLTVAAIIAIGVLLVVVVPNIKQIIPDDAAMVPTAAAFVIAISDGVRSGFVEALLILGLLAGSALAAKRTARGRAALDGVILRLPGIGALAKKAEAGRFLATISALLRGGVELRQSLALARQVLKNSVLVGASTLVEKEVIGGASLAASLARSNWLSPETLAILRTGERTGKLGEAAGHAAHILQTDLTRRLEAIATLAGPIVTLLLGVIAGTIVYAMLSAILSLNQLAAG